MPTSPIDAFGALRTRMSANIIGQEALVERLLIGLLANGHLLVEGLPGLAKTRAVKALARELDGKLSRVQFTPDLLPSDITGAEIYHQEDGRGIFRFEPGPIFANLVLADEINRAPAKVQAALLEAMEERQVTVAGTTHPLPEIFLVMATQNPIEQEGTYPLPEAQMDRFLMHVKVGYPSHAAEIDIVRLVRTEEADCSPVGAGRSGEFAAHCAVPVQPDGCAKPSVEITPSYIVLTLVIIHCVSALPNMSERTRIHGANHHRKFVGIGVFANIRLAHRANNQHAQISITGVDNLVRCISPTSRCADDVAHADGEISLRVAIGATAFQNDVKLIVGVMIMERANSVPRRNHIVTRTQMAHPQ